MVKWARIYFPVWQYWFVVFNGKGPLPCGRLQCGLKGFRRETEFHHIKIRRLNGLLEWTEVGTTLGCGRNETTALLRTPPLLSSGKHLPSLANLHLCPHWSGVLLNKKHDVCLPPTPSFYPSLLSLSRWSCKWKYLMLYASFRWKW